MPDNASGTAVATTERQPNELVKFREQLEQRANELKMVLPSHITPEKFQRTVLTAAQQNPQLLTVDRRSLILACMKAAQDALLPDGREAVITPFKENKKVDGVWQTKWVAVYMPMVYGLRKKILQSGEVVALEVGVVYRREVEAGHFLYEVGLSPPLRHRPMIDLTGEDTTDDKIVGAYSIATMKDGTKSYEFMRRFEIDKVRECSQTGATRDRKGEARKSSGPWVEWYPEQAKKTAVRRHSKMLPMSGDVFIDVEGRELEASMSATALLTSTSEDPPRAIEDRSDETPHDPETGEIIETDASAVADDDAQAERAEETAQTEPELKPARGQKAEPVANAEGNGQAESAGESASAVSADVKAEASAEAADDSHPEADASDEPHPGTAIADKIIAEINAPENNAVMDVSRILSKHELDIAAMQDADAVRVEIAADKRRNAIRKEREAAKAEEVAG